MKKTALFLFIIFLVGALITACKGSEDTGNVSTDTTDTEVGSTETANTDTSSEKEEDTTTEDAAKDTEEDSSYEGDAYSQYINENYVEQIRSYYIALSEKWDAQKYTDKGLSALPCNYYEGNSLNNVGFGFTDLNNDGYWELIIGAILDSEKNPAVFEIWTLVDDKPVMVVQADSKNQYVLQYVEEDDCWYVVKEVTDSKDKQATYYLMLVEQDLEVMQGIVYDAKANKQSPWFMTYDLDGDTGNDESIDEENAKAILESNKKHYTAVEYFPYSLYK
jgi:hypothetical protein